MDKKTITSIQFKRGLKVDLETILVGTKKPTKGEPVWEYDTKSFKIGDGEHDYKDLPYMTGEASDRVLKGYYDSGVFWNNQAEPRVQLMRSVKYLYLELSTNEVYYYAVDGKYHKLVSIAQVSSTTPGLVKLYDTTGQNVDGTMTQKAITDNLSKKFELSLDEESSECLIFRGVL